MSHVRTMPRGILYPLDIGATFFNNLSSEIKKMMETGTFEIPQRPHPDTNVAADDRVLAIRDQDIQVEAQLKVLKPAASRYGAAPNARGSGAQSFFALPPGMDGMDRHDLMEIMGPEVVAEFQMDQGTSAFAAMVGDADGKVAADHVPAEIVASVAMLQSGDPDAQGCVSIQQHGGNGYVEGNWVLP